MISCKVFRSGCTRTASTLQVRPPSRTAAPLHRASGFRPFCSFTLTPINNNDQKLTFTGKITIGSTISADLCIEHPKVATIHAEIEERRGRVFCTALSSEEEILLADTWTWLQGNHLRRGVQYLCPPGGELAFGDETLVYRLDFEEANAKADVALFTLMTQQLAGTAQEEVKKILRDTNEGQ
eukprot:jgi/Botrbrau1/15742/Bobra.4_1s0110.1